MVQLTDNVRKLLPALSVNDVTCFVLYDKHPLDPKKLDITVCTTSGELREYYKQELVSSLNLDIKYSPTDIQIIRNSRSELFYLVHGESELTIITTIDGELKQHHQLKLISKYEIIDPTCSGDAVLRVCFLNSSLAFTSDNNFTNFICEKIRDSRDDSTPPCVSAPVLTSIPTKLIEAKFSLRASEELYQSCLKLRQAVTFSSYKKMHPNLDDSMFKDDFKNLAGALNIRMQTPWRNTCNKKLVVVYNLCNKGEQALKNVHIILHGYNKTSLEYTSKIYEKTKVSPLWIDTKLLTLEPSKEYALVLTIDLEEFYFEMLKSINFHGLIMYRNGENECFVPIDDVKLSPSEYINDEFDILHRDRVDEKSILAILASSMKTDLIINRLLVTSTSSVPEKEPLSPDIFTRYLHMEQLDVASNLYLSQKSPSHLSGMLIFVQRQERNQMAISVYSGSITHVVGLITQIQSLVPEKLLISLPDQIITPKYPNVTVPAEIPPVVNRLVCNYKNYATSMLQRTGLINTYLDRCMLLMHKSKNPVVKSKIGTEVDLFIQGEASFLKFKSKMREYATKGLIMSNNDEEILEVKDEIMDE